MTTLKKLVFRWTLPLLIAASSLALWTFTLHYKLLWSLFFNSAYYFISFLFFVWAGTVIYCLRSEKFGWRTFFGANWKGLVFALALSAVIFVFVSPMIRMVNDEFNMLSVSQSMTYARKSEIIMGGYWKLNHFEIEPSVTGAVLKQNLLFSYVTHLVHVALGYRADNVFVLNMLFLFSLLFFICLLLRKYMGHAAILGCLFLVVSQPLLAWCARSGGVDLFSALFIFIVLYCLKKFLENPSAETLLLLWINMLMASNTRQECALGAAIIGCFLLAFGYVKKEFLIKYRILYSLTPLLLTSLYWMRLIALNPYEQPAGTAAFSKAFFLEHGRSFFYDMVNTAFSAPCASFINLAGFIGLLYFIFRTAASRDFFKNKPERHFALIVFFTVLSQWAVIASFYAARPDSPIYARYYLLFDVSLSLLAGLFLLRMKLFGKKPLLFLVLSILVFGLYFPVSVKDGFVKQSKEAMTYQKVLDFFKTLPDRSFLIITEWPVQFNVQEYGSVSFDFANQHKDKIKHDLAQRVYHEVYVVQEISFGTVRRGDFLSADYQIEPVWENRITSNTIIRISKLISPAEKPGQSLVAP